MQSGGVQGAIEEGILFTDAGANRDRNRHERVTATLGDTAPPPPSCLTAAHHFTSSKVSWLERPSTADEDEPTVPEWLHTRLRKAANSTHTRYGDKICPVGVSSNGHWTPKYEPIQYTEYPAGSHYGAWRKSLPGRLCFGQLEILAPPRLISLISRPQRTQTRTATLMRSTPRTPAP